MQYREIRTPRKIVFPPNFIHGKIWKYPTEKIMCEVCGKYLKQISWNHLLMHKMTIDQYKEEYKLPYGVGLTSNSTKDKKRQRQNALIKQGRVNLIKPGDPRFTGGLKKGTKMLRISPASGVKLRGVRKSPAAGIKQSKTMKNLMEKRPELLKNFLSYQKRRACYICSHNNRRQIENLIKKGLPNKHIGTTFALSRSAVDNHRIKCMKIIRNGKRGISNYKEMDCIVCKKHFGYYHYSYMPYERKVCNNKCKGILFSKPRVFL